MKASLSLKESIKHAWSLWRGNVTVAFSGAEGAQRFIDLYMRHGPLTVKIDADPEQEWFPEGRVLERVKITRIDLHPDGTSISVEWESDRPIRSGVMSWLLGP